jgi:hypothetical protein
VEREPLVPIAPKDAAGRPGRWVPHAKAVRCGCGGVGLLEFPANKVQGVFRLYGDEAYRDDDDKKRRVATYAVVGGSPTPVDEAAERLSSLKRRMEPNRNPDTWSFHMRCLWSGSQRKKHEVYSNWQMAKVVDAVNSMLKILSGTDHLYVYTISVVSRAAKTAATKAQHDAFLTLTMKVISDVTKLGGQPVFQFDSEKPMKGPTAIHGWAKRMVLDSQHSVLYAYLAHGIEIPEPQFVRPASEPCLEMADLVAWVVARHHLDKWRGKESEFDPAGLGTAIPTSTT